MQTYLILSLLIPIAILVLSKRVLKNYIILFLTAILLLGSVYMLSNYIRSNDKSLYKNVETHAIEHLGYDFANDYEIALFDSENPANALFDEELGEFKIKVDTVSEKKVFHVQYKNLKRPLFISIDKKGNDYKIADDSLPVWKPNESLIFEFSKERKLSLHYIIDNNRKHNFIVELSKNKKSVIDTIEFQRFNIGYPLLDLIEKSADIELNKSETESLEDTFLVRNKIYSDPKKNPLSTLHLFPSKLLDSTKILINNIAIEPVKEDKKIILNDRSYFYIGIGQGKTDKFQLNFQKERSLISYKSPIRYPLFFNDSINVSELLISTSVNDIIKSSREYDGVINFEGRNIFNNIYHINASIKYAVEDGQTALKAVKIDNNSGKLKLEDIENDKKFPLLTNTESVNFLVKIKNYNNNKLTKFYWIPFAIIFMAALLFFYLMHYYKDKLGFFGINESSKIKFSNAIRIEYSIYCFITVFLSVRIYMLWRMYAFPPLENITYLEFEKLQSQDSFIWTLIFLVAFIFFRFALFLINIKFQSKIIDFKEWSLKKWNITTNYLTIKFKFLKKIGKHLDHRFYRLILIKELLLWVFTCLTIFLSTGTQLFIFFSLTIPLICFLYLDSKIEKKYLNSKKLYFFYKFINAIIYIALYIKFDAGFIVIASGITLFYFALKSSYYAFQNYSKRRKYKKHLYSCSIYLFLFCTMFFAHLILPLLPVVKNIDDGRIAARGEIINSTPGEMLLNAKFNSDKATKILWASESFWFADNHLYERVKNKAGYSFPNIRTKYNSRGVSLTVQTREFSVLRYLIFEHSINLPLYLLAHFLALLFIIGYYYFPKKETEPSKYFRVLGAISFFLVLGFMMYLVCINSVTFIGQDFPFLTLTGKASILIPFIVIGYIFYNLSNSNLRDDQNKRFSLNISLPAIIICIVLSSIVIFKVSDMYTKIEDSNMITHEAKQPVEKLKNFVDLLNNSFHASQKLYKQKNGIKKLGYESIPKLLKEFLGAEEEDRSKKIDKIIDLYADNKTDANYLKSALKSFDLDKFKNLDHILHVRKKRYGDQFEFVVNKNYYSIKPIFESSKDNPKWEGDVLAMDTPNQYYIKTLKQYDSVSTFMKGQLIDRRAPNEKPIPLNDKNLVDSQLIELYRVQSEWLFSNDDVIIMKVSNKENVKKITLSNRTRIYKEQYSNSFPDLLLNNGDIVKLEDHNAFKISYDNENYLALNYNYNGKKRFFYPLGKGMVWAYNYTKLLEQNYEKYDTKSQKRTTIDFQLQQKLYDLALKQELHNDLFLTVVDGDGHIRLMFDYNKNKQADKINPNDYRKLSKIYEEIYFNTRQEKYTLGSRNIRKMTYSGGFGSTIKPIIYGAVTSQHKMNWESIKVLNKNNSEIFTSILGTNTRQVNYFGNQKLTTPWIEASYEFNAREINNQRYIINSLNMYNAIVMLLGSYDERILDNYTTEILRLDSENIKMNERFPRFSINDKKYVLSKGFYKNLPNDLNNDSYVLKTGLNANFNFNVSRKKRNIELDSSSVLFDNAYKMDPFYQSDTLFQKALKNSNFNYQWVFPEKQSFIKNSFEISGDDIMQNIINPAKGGSPFEVTQLGMLENLIRLYKLNSNFKATIEPQKDSLQIPVNFALDNNWTTASYSKFVKEYIYESMHMVASDGGTASSVFDKKNTFKRENTNTKQEQTFYIYAKTGTHNSNEEGTNDKSLIILISDIDLSLEVYNKEPKLYTILLTLNAIHDKQVSDHRKEIFKIITSSESFKLYYKL